jgi:hypothetical protein
MYCRRRQWATVADVVVLESGHHVIFGTYLSADCSALRRWLERRRNALRVIDSNHSNLFGYLGCCCAYRTLPHSLRCSGLWSVVCVISCRVFEASQELGYNWYSAHPMPSHQCHHIPVVVAAVSDILIPSHPSRQAHPS